MYLHPEVLNDLCRQYRNVTRSDIAACWANAHRHWCGINLELLNREPAELTAARTLFVHSQFDRNPEDRANFSYCMWQLVTPYTATSR
jgi:hypothetical protein